MHGTAWSIGPLLLFTIWQVSGCTVYEFTPSGFSANVLHLATAVPIFDGTNGTLYLDNTHFPHKCSTAGGWHDFFDTETLPQWTEGLEKDDADYPCYRVSGSQVHKVVQALDVHEGFQEEGVKKAWVLQEWLREEVDQALAQLGAHGGPTIGLHIRGGDKAWEDQQLGREGTTPADVVSAFTEAFPDVKGGTCVVIGDEKRLVEETARLARKTLGCKPYKQRKYFYRHEGHDQESFNGQPLRSRCKHTAHLLADIELLAHTDFFAGSYNSGIPILVELLRRAKYGKLRSTFVDASVGRYDWASHLRRFFRSGAGLPVASLVDPA